MTSYQINLLVFINVKREVTHLREFVRRLKMQDINYEPTILSQNRFENIIKQ